MDNMDLREIIEHIPPGQLSYQEWINVGMGLHHEGYTADVWDRWSQGDARRYHAGECWRKWDTFRGAPTPVTAGTLVQMAKDHGWRPPVSEGYALDWDDEIERDDYEIIDRNWLQPMEVAAPSDGWQPVREIVTYLETLFDVNDNIGYVTSTWYDEQKQLHKPTQGSWSRTAGQLIQELTRYGSVQDVFGDYKEDAGAWIRFNPLDGKGVKNDNVTDYRYALVESDDMTIEQQNAIIRELELPVACLVHSGGKSLHAIVRVDAADYGEYRKRVDYLYNVCQKNGIVVDTQNRNPSRLSRMPGIMRRGQKQFLVATNIGKKNWAEWYDWIEGVNDDLPEPERLADVFNNLPELSPPLIDGVLRQGHKMLLAGPSKAGKSYMLIELCIAIAEGKRWIDWQCAQGRVMYVNLELDRASCLHRFRDVYRRLGLSGANAGNVDIWNLRGKSVPMDKLAPKLIRRAQKKDYIAIVIDPIYKVITGDENSADQMAHFTNQFDKVCTELGSAVIYCHHHSKGYQGGKRSMDRASGSGVFARDPDALIDLTQLDVPEQARKTQAEATLGVQADAADLEAKAEQLTAWRVESTLREYPSFAPVDLWFDYPVHVPDTVGALKDYEPESDKAPWQKAIDKRKSPEDKKAERMEALETALDALSIDDQITVSDLAEYLGVSMRTAWSRIREHGSLKTAKIEGQKETVILWD